jgi:hypothetical protein
MILKDLISLRIQNFLPTQPLLASPKGFATLHLDDQLGWSQNFFQCMKIRHDMIDPRPKFSRSVGGCQNPKDRNTISSTVTTLMYPCILL